MHDEIEMFSPEEMQSPFDVIKETDAEGREWWNSRKLARLMEYGEIYQTVEGCLYSHRDECRPKEACCEGSKRLFHERHEFNGTGYEC